MTKDQIRYLYEQGLENIIPRHMHQDVRAHVEHGNEVGGFLTALLEGDPMAFGRADPTNAACCEGWEIFLADHLPADCYGTPGKVSAWRAMGGLDGYPDGGP